MKNAEEGLTFEVDGELSLFQSLEIDGTVVAAGNYTLAEGSTIITLKNSYLNTLAVGTHNVKVLYSDGKIATTSFQVQEENNNTGDTGNTGNNGNTGDTGNTGNNGNAGDNGNTGNNGSASDNENTGDNGSASDNENTSDNGNTSSNGNAGNSGSTSNNSSVTNTDNGSSTESKVQENVSFKAPKTGDDSNVVIWLMIICLSVAALGGISFMRRKRANSDEIE